MSRQALKDAVETALRSAPSSDADKKKRMIDAMIAAYTDVDHEFMKCLYWPDSSEPARMPQKFPQPTSLFTQRYHTTVSTGANGEGTILFLPQDTSWASLFIKPSIHLETAANDDDAQIGNVNQSLTYNQIGQDNRYIAKTYSEVRCVGASIKLTYIGTTDECSGIMTTSHQFNKSIFQIDEDSIENGFHKKTCKPQDGIRAVYMPKSNNDLEFRAADNYITEGINSINPSTYYPERVDRAEGGHGGDYVYGPTYNATNYGMNWGALPNADHPISKYLGMHDKEETGSKPNTIAIVFQGLPVNKTWLRLDIVRHFEAVPREHVRELVSLRKTTESEKTLDFVQRAGHNTKLHTQTHKEAAVQEVYVKPVAHTLPDNPQPAQIDTATTGYDWGGLLGSVLGAAGGLYSGGGIQGAITGATMGNAIGSVGGGGLGALQQMALPYEQAAIQGAYGLEQQMIGF